MSGRPTRILRKDQIERLQRFRRASHEGAPAGYSYPQLRLAMGKPCSWMTLQKALRGEPVYDLIYWKLAEWIDRYVPAKPVHDGKAAAAGTDGPALPEQQSAGGGRSPDPDRETDGTASKRRSD